MPHALTAADMLAVWEVGAHRDVAGRARGTLAVAAPHLGEADLDRMALGQRDLLLLDTYRATFGDVLRARSRCPRCGEQVALDIDADQVTFAAPSSAGAPTPLEIVVGDIRVRARPPDGALVLAAAAAGSVGAAREVLLRGCIIAAHRGETPLEPGELSHLGDAVVSAVGDAIAEADPQSEVRLALVCALCSMPWSADLDIATFLWGAVVSEGRRIVEQVHALAHAYGWSEAQSLEMSSWRRKIYVERALDV